MIRQYRHSNHVGNHGDILKHSTLIYLLNYLKSKDSPFTVFDTHSGSGIYSIGEKISTNTETSDGIGKLYNFGQNNTISKSLQNYLDFLLPYLKQNSYAGSPEIERQLLRDCDFLYNSEVDKSEYELLLSNCSHNSQSSNTKPIYLNQNGYNMINELIPPKTENGLILIDPPYKEACEFDEAVNAIDLVNRKWPNGIIMLWYPLLVSRQSENDAMIAKIKQSIAARNDQTSIIDAQLLIDSSKSKSMYGCGIIVINPPDDLENELNSFLPFLSNLLSVKGSYSISK